MSRKRKLSLDLILVELLGVLLVAEVFVWVIENKVFNGEGKISIPELHYAAALVGLVVVMRLGYFIIKLWKNRGLGNPISHLPDQGAEDIQDTCSVCGKSVSDRVKAYCLDRPDRFHNRVYCYDHQRTRGG